MQDLSSSTLKLPRQDKSELSLFAATEDGVQAWVDALPIMDTPRLVDMLLQALDDLNRTSLLPQTRYNLLDALYPSIDVALIKLCKRFLNQPLIMASEPRAMAAIGNRLCTLTTAGYALAAMHAIKQRDSIRDTNPARLACQSIQRALLFNSRKILYMLQLHMPMEEGCWETQHQLYALAEYQGLTGLPVPEPLSGGVTVKAAYVQALLLSCCKPNQLRQSDLTTLHRNARDWGEKISLNKRETGAELYLADLESDKPPQYRALHREQPTAGCRALDCEPLLGELNALQQRLDTEQATFDKETGISGNLLHHVITALGSRLMRNFKRTACNSPLWICLGLNNTHRQVSLQQMLRHKQSKGSSGHDLFSSQGNPFSKGLDKAKIWTSENSADGGKQQTKVDQEISIELDTATRTKVLEEESAPASTPEKSSVFEAQLADTSANGYCLEWTDESPGDARVGDIVGIKEDRKQNDWAIAVIRWLSRLPNAKTLIGLELLSPRAIACGANVRRNGLEDSPPQRVLLLPEIKIVGQPHTLITPKASFRIRQTLLLQNNLGVRSVQLVKQLNSTGGFEQFEFRYIQELGDVLEKQGEGPNKGEFDSLWSKI